MAQCPDRAGGEALVTAAAALSIALSKGRSAEELELLATFFEVLGESLELLALHAPPADDKA